MVVGAAAVAAAGVWPPAPSSSVSLSSPTYREFITHWMGVYGPRGGEGIGDTNMQREKEDDT